MAKEFVTKRLTASSSEEDKSNYNRFVDTSPQGVLYCKTWWLEATAPDKWEVVLLVKGGQIRAAWPLVFGRSRRNITMPPLTQKLGMLFARSQTIKYSEALSKTHSLSERLLEAIPSGTHISQCFHEDFTNWLPLCWNGLQQSNRYTYLFRDLSDLESLWEGMRQRCRTPIKNAIKAGIEVEESNDIRLLYDINQRTFDRQGRKYPVTLECVKRIDEACRKYAGSRITLARDPQGQIHACDYLVYDDNCAISLMQGADPEYRKSGAQGLLDWRSIEFASSVSRKFDFEGSMMPSVEAYNRAFGATQTPYCEITGKKSSDNGPSFLRRTRLRIAGKLRQLASIVEG